MRNLSLAFDCLAVTKVTIVPGGKTDRTVATASVTLNDQLFVRGLRVIKGSNGLFVRYPTELCEDTPRPFLFPITRQLREHIENCVLEKYQADIGSKDDTERDNSQYAVVETIDYNNGETPAESNILAIDCKQACEERFAKLKAVFSADKELRDEGDTYFWFEDEETGERRSYAIKPPTAK